MASHTHTHTLSRGGQKRLASAHRPRSTPCRVEAEAAMSLENRRITKAADPLCQVLGGAIEGSTRTYMAPQNLRVSSASPFASLSKKLLQF